MASSSWQKSTYSASSDNCVEARAADGLIELRESDESDVIVRMTPMTFSLLLDSTKTGEFDHLTTSV
ncbi:DUF397 domain-containing protein [Kitasatospora sp. NPDC101183]|uniref:DUF397 domain-containing protein n=1 Tax=Kitasatospora sp. NPDC101183 TaxID=3364100 RepID=UPI003809884E